MKIREYFEFYEAQNLVAKFEELLEKYGIKIQNDCDLESKYFSVFNILYLYQNHADFEADFDCRPLFRDLVAIYDLSLKILAVQEHDDFEKLIPHLKLLNECNIAQNEKSVITDQNANKIIELYLASLCMRFCDKIILDHPQNSAGDNPDIIANIDNRNWGFACKTIHTTNPQTIFENIKKAVDQIERSNSVTGIPVINLKNIITHDYIWPERGFFKTLDHPFANLMSEIYSIKQALIHDIGCETLLDMFKGKKSLPGVLFIAQSVSSVLHENISPVATRINIMNLEALDSDKFSDEDIEVFDKLNLFMQLSN